MNWTNGKVIFASGTAFPAYEVSSASHFKYLYHFLNRDIFQYDGKTVEPGQGNNMYVHRPFLILFTSDFAQRLSTSIPV